jgi:hypothetical protein
MVWVGLVDEQLGQWYRNHRPGKLLSLETTGACQPNRLLDSLQGDDGKGWTNKQGEIRAVAAPESSLCAATLPRRVNRRESDAHLPS